MISVYRADQLKGFAPFSYLKYPVSTLLHTMEASSYLIGKTPAESLSDSDKHFIY